jgi:hypothetical protein
MFLIFGFFGICGHPSIKNFENIRAQDYGVPAIPLGRLRRGTAYRSPAKRVGWRRHLLGYAH